MEDDNKWNALEEPDFSVRGGNAALQMSGGIYVPDESACHVQL